MNKHDKDIISDRVNNDSVNGARASDQLVNTDGYIVEDNNPHPSTHVSDQLASTDGYIVTDDDLGINDRERIIDNNDRVITDDYLEVGDRERIIDDNERRLTGSDHTINNTVIRHENDNIIEDHDAIDRTAVKHMSKEAREDLNADPITGEPGSHPVGTGLGGIGGAAAGAAIGTIAGPLGTLIGGAIGAIVGGGAGHAAAEAIDPTREEAYWRAEHANASYYQQGHDFDRDLHPAYAVGYANRARYPSNARFEDHEADLQRSWEEVKGESRLAWDDARHASRDAWNRIS